MASPDPWVVQRVKANAAKTGADPTALLATSIVENGGRRYGYGDNGTSAGPFMFHRGGALGNHSFAWASSDAAVANRAQEFARLGVHGGRGAAAVQRPADPSGYAVKVNDALAEARRILGMPATIGTPVRLGPAPANPTRATPQLGTPAMQPLDLAQNVITNYANSVGITPLTLPGLSTNAPLTLAGPQASDTGSVAPAQRGAPTNPTFGNGLTGVKNAKVIGTPFQGTHAKAFNARGGSDNWQSENAVDVAVPVGTPIYAPANGVIGSRIGSLGSGGRFAGQRVNLQSGAQAFYLAHLSRLAVKAGQRVKKGQLIGYSGSANGVGHLHFAVQNGDPRKYA